MLARLQEVPTIADARVECSGTYFAFSLRAGADREASIRALLEALGPGSRLLSGDEAAAQLQARRRGELWFSGEQIRGLSYVEARVIAARALTAATQGLSLGERESEAIREAVRVEVFAAIDRVHDEGGRSSSGWFAEAWPHIVARAQSRMGPALPASTLAEVAERLARLH